MKRSLKLMVTAVFAGALAMTASVSAEETASDSASDSATTSKVAAQLNGKLLKAADGKSVEAKLTGDPEVYVLYHSASW